MENKKSKKNKKRTRGRPGTQARAIILTMPRSRARTIIRTSGIRIMTRRTHIKAKTRRREACEQRK